MVPHNPLQQLHALDKTSPQFHEQLGSFLRGDEYRGLLPRLRGEALTWLVEYLDSVLVGIPDKSGGLFQPPLQELRRICGIREVLPKSCILPEPLLGCVYEGVFDGSKVRVRRIKLSSGKDSQKIFYQVAVLSKNLVHPNIVPLLGVTTEPLELISDWMPGGDLPEYIARHPKANRLSLLSDVAEGLNYLHSCDVIHGDLKGSNILVDVTGHARITDFGLAMITQDQRSGSTEHGNGARWIAPEILDGRGTYSKEADIFSFAGVTIEVFTGAAPFSDKSPRAALSMITNCKRPPRPTSPTLTKNLWVLIQQCWNQEPRLRPDAPRIPCGFGIPAWERLITRPLGLDERISLITGIFSDRDETEVVGRLHGDDAQAFVNVVDEVLDGLPSSLRKECLKTLCKICSREAVLPKSVQISLHYNQTDTPLYYGGHSEVWKSQHEGREVAVKVLRVYQTSNFNKVRRKFCKEVLTWKALCHPNILPLLGVTMGEHRFAMISEWMDNGNINNYVKVHKDANRFELLADVARGLIYVHGEGMIHGDLKGANILVDQHGHACLADFGLVMITSDPAFSRTSSSSAYAGTTRWMSPELLDPDQRCRPTKESDCYALGMVIYEVLSGQIPFASCKNFLVPRMVVEGEHPGRPLGTRGAWFTDDLWKILEQCWSTQPEDRPATITVLEQIKHDSEVWEPILTAVEDDGEMDDGSVSTVSYYSGRTILRSNSRSRGFSQGRSSSVGDSVARRVGDEHPDPADEESNLASFEGTTDPRYPPAAIASHRASVLISLREIADWEGNSQDFSPFLTTVFEAGEYLDLVRNFRVLGIDPFAYINNLDKIIDTLPTDSDLWKQCIQALSATCSSYGVLPASHEITFTLTKPRGEPFRSNNFSDLRRLTDSDNRNQVFAVKLFHVSKPHSFQEINKNYCWVAVVSKRMDHPNILSIEGVVPTLSRFCLVSKWMVNGNMVQYVKNRPKVNRLELLAGVARGLDYLHQNGLAHGSLKSSNVLIDAKGCPRLSGFSLWPIRRVTDPIDASVPDFDSRARYSAPELLDAAGLMRAKKERPTRKSDVYSLSMVIVELATGQEPFHGSTDRNVVAMVSSGKRPQKPRRFDAPEITQEVWALAERCWNGSAEERPEVTAVLQDLKQIVGSGVRDRRTSIKQTIRGMFN